MKHKIARGSKDVNKRVEVWVEVEEGSIDCVTVLSKLSN